MYDIMDLHLHIVIARDPDIIAITESWSNETIESAFLKIPGYKLPYRQDRLDKSNGHGGGVLLYIRESLVSN